MVVWGSRWPIDFFPWKSQWLIVSVVSKNHERMESFSIRSKYCIIPQSFGVPLLSSTLKWWIYFFNPAFYPSFEGDRNRLWTPTTTWICARIYIYIHVFSCLLSTLRYVALFITPKKSLTLSFVRVQFTIMICWSRWGRDGINNLFIPDGILCDEKTLELWVTRHLNASQKSKTHIKQLNAVKWICSISLWCRISSIPYQQSYHMFSTMQLEGYNKQSSIIPSQNYPSMWHCGELRS